MVTTNKTIPNPAYEMLNKKLLNESTIPLMILIDIIINGREIKKTENINTTINNAINITIGMMMKKKESTPRLSEAIIALIIFRRLGVTLA